jgi:GNAT superfamily N-acetyltransferase
VLRTLPSPLGQLLRRMKYSNPDLPPSQISGVRVIELEAGGEPLLQGFFDANPEYFLAIQGEPAAPTEAHEEIHGGLPSGWSFTKKWVIGYVKPNGSLMAMANLVSDILAHSVWNLSTFIVATERHGTGDAQLLYRGLEHWAMAKGANWLRLGVVQGNTRAERFWESMGYVQTRRRHGVEFGARTHTLRVMFKPLASGSVEEYLSLVPRDRPEAPNAR